MNFIEQIILVINTYLGYGIHAGSSAISNLSYALGLF